MSSPSPCLPTTSLSPSPPPAYLSVHHPRRPLVLATTTPVSSFHAALRPRTPLPRVTRIPTCRMRHYTRAPTPERLMPSLPTDMCTLIFRLQSCDLIRYCVGGGTRLAGFLLARCTLLLLLIGTAPIGYIRAYFAACAGSHLPKQLPPRSDSYSVALPSNLPPTFKGRALRFSYQLIVGTCQASSPFTPVSPSAIFPSSPLSTPGLFSESERRQSRVMQVPIRVHNYVAGECDYECVGGTLTVVA